MSEGPLVPQRHDPLRRASSARRLAFRRTALTSAGAALAVAPLFALRIAIALALVGLTQLDVGLVTYLPLELLVPLLTAWLVTRRRPAIGTLKLTTRVFGVALVAAPLILAFTAGSEYMRHFGDATDVGQMWLALMALVPSVGALGLFGFLMLAFPFLLATFVVTSLIDALYCRARRDELADIERARQLRERMAEGFYDIPGLPKSESEALSRDFEALGGDLERLIAGFSFGTDEGRLARTMRDQLHEALGNYAQVARLLRQKLSPTELTYQRYLASARHVYRSLVQQLRTATDVAAAGTPGQAKADEVRLLVGRNEEGLRVMRETADAIARMRLEQGREAIDLGRAVKELEELAKRADQFQ